MTEKELEWKQNLGCNFVLIGFSKWLAVFDDTVKVGVQKGIFSKSPGQITGELLISDISDIKYQEPGFGAGAFILVKRGTNQTTVDDGKLFNYPNGNSYGLSFQKKSLETSKEVYEHLMEKIKSASKENSKPNDTNALDDLKKLSELKDQGILSEEEFESKKKDLLDKI